jgi:hypothetical protein
MRNEYAYFAVAICLIAPGFDQAAASSIDSPAASSSTKAKAGSDDWVCQKIVVTGSRIGARKFCATREQWAERQLQDRQVIEKIQASPCVIQSTSPTGRPSC